MQRYRVNYQLLIGLAVGLVVAAGAIYGAWHFQVQKNAGSLLKRADDALEAGDLKECVSCLRNYVGLRRNDDDARIRLGNSLLDLAGEYLEEGEMRYANTARSEASRILSRYPDEAELRRKLVDFDLENQMFLRAYTEEVTSHISKLLASSPEDPELLEGHAMCLLFQQKPREAAAALYPIVGYDKESKTFDTEKAIDPARYSAYQTLAFVLYRQPIDDLELSLEMMSQMIAANPDSSEAFLVRGRWLSAIDKGADSEQDYGDEALADLLKSIELDPDNTGGYNGISQHYLKKADEETNLANKARDQGDVAEYEKHKNASDEFVATARKYLEQGLEKDKESPMFYLSIANLERRDGNLDKAVEVLDQGVKNVDDEVKLFLKLERPRYLVYQEKFDEAKDQLDKLAGEINSRHPKYLYRMAEYYIATSQWTKAKSCLLDSVDALQGTEKIQGEFWLAMCHSNTNEPELAIEAADRVLAAEPENDRAAMLKQAIQRRLGREETQVASSDNDEGSVALSAFDRMVQDELEKPESAQDWDRFFKFLESQAKIRELSPAQTNLMKANLYVRLRRYSEANKLLKEAYQQVASDEDSDEKTAIQLKAIDIISRNPDQGPAVALEKLDSLMASGANSPPFVMTRIRLLSMNKKDDLVNNVLAIANDTDNWDKNDRIRLWTTVSSSFERAGHVEEAEDALKTALEIDGKENLSAQLKLFKMAFARFDNEAMKEAQDKILKIVGSKSDSNWSLTEASREFALVLSGEADDSTLEGVYRRIERILNKRPDWHEPYLLRAKIKYYQKDYLGASNDYETGLSRGPGTVPDVKNYTKLLASQQRWNDAFAAIEDYSDEVRLALMEELYPEILFRTKRFSAAAEAADQLAVRKQDNAQFQLVYANFMGQIAGLPDDVAGADKVESIQQLKQQCLASQTEAISRAVEIAPKSPEVWFVHARNALARGDRNETERIVQQAQLAVDEDNQPKLLAQCYAMLGRWFDAENIFVKLHEENPEDAQIARQLAEFYIGPTYRRPDQLVKATKLVNQVLHMVEDGKDVSSSDAQWARRTAARIYSANGGYQNLVKAENLLASNSVQGALPLEDRLEMAKILASRPEQVSKRKSIRLYEEIQSQSGLALERQLDLAKLYFATGDWDSTRSLMSKLITAAPNSPVIRNVYIRMLLQRDEPSERSALNTQMNVLQKIAPNAPSTIELFAQVADKTNNSEQGRQALRRMVPGDFSKLSVNDLRRILQIAKLLTHLKDIDGAEVIYKKLVTHPKATPVDSLALAQFIGIYRDPAEGYAMIEKLSSDLEFIQVLDAAINIAHETREKTGDKFDDQIDRWINRALRDDPGSVIYRYKKASFRELQRRYTDAAAIYRELLEDDDLEGRLRAAVLNNLAFDISLGAVEAKSPNESAELINEAVELLGPISDILDTRAVIHIGRKDYKAAVEDLELAVIDEPTAEKYLHKAIAHLGLNQRSEAVKAWEKAEEMGLKRDDLKYLEIEQYDKAKAEIGR